MNRRQFLKWLALISAAALNSCARRPEPVHGAPVLPTSAPSGTPLPPTGTPAASPTSTPSPTATPDPRVKVGIARAASYDPALVRRQLQTLLDGPGGLSDVVKPGARVAIKPNLTGAAWWDAALGMPGTECFATHPAVVGALAELCRDCGAGALSIVEGLADESTWQTWGYQDMAAPLGAQLVNLCKPAPYADFAFFPVGGNFLAFDRFALNPLLSEIDVLISAAKLKVHATTGTTLTLKNLVGLTPIEPYSRNTGDTNRSALHNTVNGFDDLMPRVIIDLNRACPVQLGVIDGIITCEGAAGPWDATLHQVSPGLLLAGRDPVAVDAVGTAVMGFDPQAPTGARPFYGGENIMELAFQAGIGTNRLADIQVTGESIDSVRFPFKLVGES